MVGDRRDAHPDPAGAGRAGLDPLFRWKLLGDNAACIYFKKMPTGITNPAWTKQMSENEKPCQ